MGFVQLTALATTLKVAWALAVTLWLAAGEPFWHQAVLVLGGALITAVSVLGAAIITTRRLEQPLHDVKQKVEADRRSGD